MPNRARTVLVLVLGGLVAAWGCGDDGSSDGTDGVDAAIDAPVVDEATTCPERAGELVAGVPPTFVADASHFYIWDNQAHELRRIPIAGGASELVTPIANLSGPFVVGDQHVFYVAGGIAYRVPKAGGTPEAFGTVPGSIVKRATDGTAYYTMSIVDESFEIRRAATPGVDPALLATTSATVAAIDAFAADGTHAYWTSAGVVSRVPTTTAGPIEIVADSHIETPAITTSRGLGFAGDDVIWTASYQSFADGRLFAIPKAGGDRRVLSRTGLFSGLDIEDDVVYAALTGDPQSKIAAIRLDGSPRTIVGCIADRLFEVEANAFGVFAAEDQAVLRFPVP